MNHSAARERITTITNTSHTHQHTRANDELTAASCEIQHSWRLHQRSRDDEVKPRGREKTSKYGGERWRLTVVLLSSACHSDGRGGRWVEGGRSVLWLERCTRRSSDTDRTRRSLFFFPVWAARRICHTAVLLLKLVAAPDSSSWQRLWSLRRMNGRRKVHIWVFVFPLFLSAEHLRGALMVLLLSVIKESDKVQIWCS